MAQVSQNIFDSPVGKYRLIPQGSRLVGTYSSEVEFGQARVLVAWQRTFDEVAAEHPQVTTAYNHVDAACIYLVQDPQRYDVIVTDNLFGDILTDLGGAISGGIGFAASANLNPARTGPSMFEPVHGSAPDIVGTGKANPTAAILSAALMLDFLGEGAAADRIRAACDEPVSGSTTEIGSLIAARVAG